MTVGLSYHMGCDEILVEGARVRTEFLLSQGQLGSQLFGESGNGTPLGDSFVLDVA